MSKNLWKLILGIILVIVGVGLGIAYLTEHHGKNNKATHITILLIVGIVLAIAGLALVIWYIVSTRPSKKQSLENMGIPVIEMPAYGGTKMM
jgi:hypothetical protein